MIPNTNIPIFKDLAVYIVDGDIAVTNILDGLRQTAFDFLHPFHVIGVESVRLAIQAPSFLDKCGRAVIRGMLGMEIEDSFDYEKYRDTDLIESCAHTGLLPYQIKIAPKDHYRVIGIDLFDGTEYPFCDVACMDLACRIADAANSERSSDIDDAFRVFDADGYLIRDERHVPV